MTNPPRLDYDSVPAPTAKVVPFVEAMFNDTRADEYRWMHDADSAEVLSHLKDENSYAARVMAPTLDLQRELFSEMRSRTVETKVSVSVKRGEWLYYYRMEKDQPYPIFCRRGVETGAPEQVVLDQNDLASGTEAHDLGVMEVSPDHRLLAYAEDRTGSERYSLRIKDLASGEVLELIGNNTGVCAAWASDSATLFYTTLDRTNRPCRVHRHRLGTPASDDVVMFHEPDEHYEVSVSRTRDEAYILITLVSQITSEEWFLDASQPLAEFQVIEPRQEGVEYYAEHRGDYFWIRTNRDAENFCLMRALVTNPGRAHWESVIANREDVYLEDFDVFRDCLVVCERKDAVRHVRIYSYAQADAHELSFPDPVYTVEIDDEIEFDTPALRLHYTSLTTPYTVYDYRFATRELVLLKRDEIAGFDPAAYVTSLLHIPARDGESVPVVVLHRKDLARDGRNPMILYAYGAYGDVDDPGFDVQWLSLVDRGAIYAFAHVRGSSAKGRGWYRAGKLLKKMNTFTDFLDCAEFFVREQYTTPERLFAAGRSAGGLVVGAVVNIRPELFAGAVADVPFVDVLTTMLDTSMPLTTTEFDEWGDPSVEEFYRYMRRYSPYDNVAARPYPSMLIEAGLNDTRVSYREPAKWATRLRAQTTSGKPILLKTDMGSGHGGSRDRYAALRDYAFECAFILGVCAETGPKA